MCVPDQCQSALSVINITIKTADLGRVPCAQAATLVPLAVSVCLPSCL